MTTVYRAKPRQDRSDGSIDAILDAADVVFRRVGVASATTLMIAKEAAISVGGLYYWFIDKGAVADALSRRHQERLATFLSSQLVGSVDVMTIPLVQGLAKALADFVRANPGVLVLLRRDVSGEANAPEVNMRDQMVSLVAAMIAQRVEGTTPSEQLLVAAVVVEIAVALVDLAVNSSEVDPNDIEAELAYVVAAYLYARYPSVREAHGSVPYPIRPARLPGGPPVALADVPPIYPAMPSDANDSPAD